MRQAVFVVLMVAAAFLGGAAVNGPGVRWVQVRLLEYLGVKEGEIASVDLPDAPAESSVAGDPVSTATPDGPSMNAAGASLPGSPVKSKEMRGPATADDRAVDPPAGRSRSRAAGAGTTAGKPASEAGSSGQSVVANVLGSLLGFEGGGEKKDGGPGSPASSSSTTKDRSPRTIRRTGAASETAPHSAMGGGRPAGQPSPNPPIQNAPVRPNVGERAVGQPPAPLDPTVAPAILASLSPSAAPGSADADRAGADAIPLETAPSPSGPSPSSSPPVASVAQATTPGANATPWAALRRKLQSAGVTRYTIEGEPGGRVVFSCLIPLAGRQAVAQRFEAEADDEFEAAQAAIRRITLWRAARQAPAPAH